MSKDRSLKIIMIFAFAGILFSGYLSYEDLFVHGCSQSFISCGVEEFRFANLPACVYGLIMYSFIFVISIVGYKSK